MENNIALEKNPLISIGVAQGHFTTNITHFNHYLDMCELKFNARIARDVAQEFAIPYANSVLVDSIVCMECTEVIGAYLAEELAGVGRCVLNGGREIHVFTPIQTTDNKLIFPDNRKHLIKDKNTVVLLASINTGGTIAAIKECIDYYGGTVVGISTMFLSKPRTDGEDDNIHTMFTADDIPGFMTYKADECKMCNEGQKLDAVIYSEGFMEIS